MLGNNNVEDYNNAVLVEDTIYDLMISIRAGAALGKARTRVYGSKGAILETMYDNAIVDAVLLNITTTVISDEQKDMLKLALSYGTWLMAVKDDILSKVFGEQEFYVELQQVRDVSKDISLNGVSDAKLAALYNQFGLTAP